MLHAYFIFNSGHIIKTRKLPQNSDQYIRNHINIWQASCVHNTNTSS